MISQDICFLCISYASVEEPGILQISRMSAVGDWQLVKNFSWVILISVLTHLVLVNKCLPLVSPWRHLSSKLVSLGLSSLIGSRKSYAVVNFLPCCCKGGSITFCVFLLRTQNIDFSTKAQKNDYGEKKISSTSDVRTTGYLFEGREIKLYLYFTFSTKSTVDYQRSKHKN